MSWLGVKGRRCIHLHLTVVECELCLAELHCPALTKAKTTAQLIVQALDTLVQTHHHLTVVITQHLSCTKLLESHAVSSLEHVVCFAWHGEYVYVQCELRELVVS